MASKEKVFSAISARNKNKKVSYTNQILAGALIAAVVGITWAYFRAGMRGAVDSAESEMGQRRQAMDDPVEPLDYALSAEEERWSGTAVDWQAIQSNPDAYLGLRDLKPEFCNIERVKASKLNEQMIRQYMSTKRPFIVEGHWQNDDDNDNNSDERTADPAQSDTTLGAGASHFFSQLKKFRDMYDNTEAFDSALSRVQMAQLNGSPAMRCNATVISPIHIYGKPLFKHYRIPSSMVRTDILSQVDSFLRRVRSEFGYPSSYLVFGPTGGGASYHIDYFRTGFWNLLLSGSKYWVLYPPIHAYKLNRMLYNDTTTPSKNGKLQREEETTTPNYVFLHKVVPQLAGRGVTGMLQCRQNKGDLLVAPAGGFGHVTVNLQPSVSVTANTVTDEDFAIVWNSVCFEQNRQRKLDFMRSMYLCVGLLAVDSKRWSKSCCASQQFVERLETFPKFVENNVTDPEGNSRSISNRHLYQVLLYSAEKTINQTREEQAKKATASTSNEGDTNKKTVVDREEDGGGDTQPKQSQTTNPTKDETINL